MPPRAKELTPAQIKGLKHPGGTKPVRVAVGGVSGLHIQIWPSGAKSWVLRTRYGEWAETRLKDGTIQRGRKKRELGLGAYPDVLPGAARDKAREAKAKLEAGIDPIAEKKATQAALIASARRGMTFAEAWEKFAAEKIKEFSTDRYRKQWQRTVEIYALPDIGKMAVQDIGLQDILRVLTPLWDDKTVTAVKVRERLEKVLAYATVQGYRTGDNPARWKGNLDMVLAAPGKVSGAENYPAVQLDDVARWWQALQGREGMGAKALAFQAMTATRSGAIRFATWDEIDLQNRLWTIQPGRQSSKIPASDTAKRIPLTDSMLALLESLPRLAGSNLVFWSPRGGALSDAAMGKTMRTIHDADLRAGGKGYVDAKTGEQAVPHGMRSAFRTWVAERTAFDGDLAEVALFHKVGNKVAQAYNRAEQVEKRRHMMDAWGGFVQGKEPEKVVQMGAR
ncbi:tyrosine-type recombinase/integrase [Sulfitobacter guttiformis]|uniref:Integrase n=1 Tax=Sulfitobacter guttiformis TaxID=74349 RepID=A0A420DMS7_9RHOB|nr:integrase arm-type DNA-binding domain-containing protein [Sulfitobacter guttiformis]KIN72794.1 putative P4-family integrase [Sulfitobacter guttiformis KCTC 32187]RKE95487.1 integrase [Sulfitobacter guttiformis]